MTGDLQAKRYYEPLDIEEARQSDMVDLVFGPFLALDREEALSITQSNLLSIYKDTN